MGARIMQEGRVYLRRSSSGQESSLATQLQWAIDKAKGRGVPLAATLADLEHMQRHRPASFSGRTRRSPTCSYSNENGWGGLAISST